jgi:2-oxoisovalerate dehydrogenase E1 component alpha subunit
MGEATGDAFQLLSRDGELDEKAAADLDLKDDDLLELFRLMLLTRRADVESTSLQRQGELAVYPPLIGQEAAQIGSAFALGDGDTIFPSYRELGAAIVRGVDLVDYLHFYRGTWHGGTYDFEETGYGMISVPIASQIPHAAGYAYGARLEGSNSVTLVYFGDGATSEGDFHEGCNFAAVFGAPLVLLCQNNHWAISVPLSRQTVAPIWRKAEAYGFPGIQVDGNDVLAVYLSTKRAVDLARSESTPTLIEALTYRLGPHSTADDASRYQPKDEIDAWRSLDPIERYRTFLEARGLLTEEVKKGYDDEANRLAAHIRDGIVGAPPPPPEDMFEWVFETRTGHLDRQKAQLAEEMDLQDG